MHRDDKQLLLAWRQGDLSAGQALFLRHYDSIERFFINKVSAECGDLVQQTFIKCVESKEQIRDDSKFRSWLFGVARNVLREYYRQKSKGRPHVDLDELSVADLAPGASTLLSAHRVQKLLLQALRQIPLKYQILLELHYWERMSIADMAEVLDLPHGTVKSRMYAARRALEAGLRKLRSGDQPDPPLPSSGAHDPDEPPPTGGAAALASDRGIDYWARQCRRDMSRSNPRQSPDAMQTASG